MPGVQEEPSSQAEKPALPASSPAAQPRTMVEQAATAIIAATTNGRFLPGDRLVEAEIARELGISRVPVREALRLLESQGVVVSTPYKGMRLMPVSNPGVAGLMSVRLALETLAMREALTLPGGAERFAAVRGAAEAFEAAAAKGDTAAVLLEANGAFHGALCRASGNAALGALWDILVRQLLVVWGLGSRYRPPATMVREHAAVLAALEAGDEPGALAALARHHAWHAGLDFEAMLAERRNPAGA